MFKKPTADEVQEYCLSRENGIDAEAFIDFYEVGGWMRGKTKIKDWKACVRTWERRNGQKDTRSRAKRFSDTIDEIARKDIEENGCPDSLD